MKPLLFPSVLIPWMLMIGAEFILFCRLVLTPGKTRYRGFESFIAVTFVCSLVSIVTAAFMTSREYFYVYYCAESLQAIALLVAVYEQFAVMFMPRWVMPNRGQIALAIAIAVTLCATFLVAICAPQQTPFRMLATARRFTAWENYAVFAALMILMQFKDYYGVYLRPRCRAIMLGLLGMTGMGMAENFILALSSGRLSAALLGFVSTTVFFGILLYWNQVFRRDDLHLTIPSECDRSVCSKKYPYILRLTGSYASPKMMASGEQKANTQ